MVKFHTGSKVCERKSERFAPIGCNSRTDGKSPDEKRKKTTFVSRPEAFFGIGTFLFSDRIIAGSQRGSGFF